MVRFGEPDAWTGDYWKGNLRYHPKGYEPPKGIVTSAAVNLHNFDTESPYAMLPGSPHSVEALKIEGVRPDFILFKPPESFNQIGITPDRVMLRYEANEALRRETIAMLRKKRQLVAAEAAQARAEEEAAEAVKHRTKASPSKELSPSPQFEDDYDSDASSATTRSVHSEPELTHNEQVLAAQRSRLEKMQKKSLKNTAARVHHEKDAQREQDELASFVNKKMQRMNDLADAKERDKKERIRIAGEREREKLLRLQVLNEQERERAAREKAARMRKMEESEAKREAKRLAKMAQIKEENAIRQAESDARKQALLAECERQEEENKAQMERKQAEHIKRLAEFEEERARQLEAFRLMQEQKSQEAAARVSYITENKEFQAQNAQARRLSEVAQRQYRKQVEKREWQAMKRKEAEEKQRKAEGAREECARLQERRETRIQANIDRKAKVSGTKAAEKKAELDMKLEEAYILNSTKREKLQRLVARREHHDAQYLVKAEKRVEKIDEAARFKELLMKERRGILYTMQQADLEARTDLKLIKLRLPTTKEKEEMRRKKLQSKKRAQSSMF